MKTNKSISLEDLDTNHPLRQHPFESAGAGVPAGYFDALPSRVQAEIIRRHHRFSISWSWQRTVGSLAGASLVALLIWKTLPERQHSLGAEALSGVSHEAIATYLDDQGVSVAEVNEPDQETIHAVSAVDSSLIHYLDVKPADIRQHIDTQISPEDIANIGS